MELVDLKFLAAASLLSGTITEHSSDGGRTRRVTIPSDKEIEAAVTVADRIWKEALKQERE